MARVTVEDCIDKVVNRFELVLIAAQRAKAVNSGVPITVERNYDKDSVVALREIALKRVKPEVLRESLIQSLQTVKMSDQIDDDLVNIENEDMDDKFEYVEDGNLYVDNDFSLDDEQASDDDDGTDLDNKGF